MRDKFYRKPDGGIVMVPLDAERQHRRETYLDKLEELHDAVRRFHRFDGVDEAQAVAARKVMFERMHQITDIQQSGEADGA